MPDCDPPSKAGTGASSNILRFRLNAAQPIINLYRRPQNGRWYAAIYDPATQQTRYVSMRTEDRALAEKRLDAVRSQLVALHAAPVEAVAPKAHTLAEAVDWYFGVHLPTRRAAVSTVQNYRAAISRFVRYAEGQGVTRLAAIDGPLVQAWQAAEGLHRARVRDDLLALRRWIAEYARIHGIDPPRIEWEIPGKVRSVRFKALSTEQIAALLHACRDLRPDLYLPTAWMLETGWRIGDVLDFQWHEAGADWITRTQQKTGEALDYPLTDALRGIMDACRELGSREGYVFRTWHGGARGGPWRYERFMQCWYTATAGLPYKITPRDLRVTFATRKAEAGCPQHVLAALLGHGDVTLAGKYYVRQNQGVIRGWA